MRLMIREKMQTSFRLFMEIGGIICNTWVQKLALHLLTVQNVNGPLHRLFLVKLLTSCEVINFTEKLKYVHVCS